MSFPVLLDTNVLYPATLSDLLLRIAEAGAYRPHWSRDILDELERNLALVVPAGSEGARRRVGAMARAFPDALVTGYEPLIDGMTCDPKDRHVLAAAVHSDCQLIVTNNLKDFPQGSLEPHHLSAVSPDGFLLDQFDLYPALVEEALRKQCSDLRRPRLTLLGLMASLERSGAPKFATELRRKTDLAVWERVRRE